jgi:hypothetical protein
MSAGPIASAQELSFEKDDIGLWKAAAVGIFYFNRTLVKPEPIKAHIPLVDRLTKGPNGTRQTRLARTIASRFFIYAEFRPETDKNELLRDSLPAAWKRTMAGGMIRGLVNNEPSMNDPRYGDIRGGLVDTIDALRENETDLNSAQAILNFLDSATASQTESHYRETLGDKKLPGDAVFYIEDTMDGMGVRDPGPNGIKRYMPGTLAQISYAGKSTLHDVLIVTRTAKKPTSAKDIASRGLIRGFNEAFDNGEGRAKAADDYIASEDLLNSTPQAAVVYVPTLEPGDVLIVPLYSQGAYYYVEEAKVSVYSTSGAILDRVLMLGGPHNDLSIRTQDRPDRPRVASDAPPGPTFKSVGSSNRVELTIDTSGGNSPTFEVCVPAGKTYVPIGRQEQVTIEGPMIAIAQNDETYVAIGSQRSTGNSLVLVPASQVTKSEKIDERTDSEKAFAAEAAAQVARNNARARGEKVETPFLKKAPQRPRANGLFGNVPSPLPRRNGRPKASMPQSDESEKPQSPDPKPAEAPGPEFKAFEGIVTFSLTVRGKDEPPYVFEGCVNAGNSYKPTGRQIEVKVDPRKPIRLAAEGPEHYVARVTNAKTKSIALVLIPKSTPGEVQKPE